MKHDEGSILVDSAGWVQNTRTGEIAHVVDLARGAVIGYADGQAYVSDNNTSSWLADRLLHHVFTQNGSSIVCSRHDLSSAEFSSRMPIAVAKEHVLSPVNIQVDVADMRVREVSVKRRLLPVEGITVWLSLATLNKTCNLQCAKSVGTWLSKHKVQWKQWDRERIESFVDLLFRAACPATDEIVYTNAAWRFEGGMWRSAGASQIIHCDAGKLRLADLPEYLREGVQQQAHALLDEFVPLSTILRTLGVEKGTMELLRQLTIQVSLLVERWLWLASFEGDVSVASTVHQQRKQNVQYVLSTRRFMDAAQDVSIAVDGTRVGKRKILLGVIGDCGTRKAAPAVPQVRIARHLY
eukprot:3155448-Amphidinium_carterae.2